MIPRVETTAAPNTLQLRAQTILMHEMLVRWEKATVL